MALVPVPIVMVRGAGDRTDPVQRRTTGESDQAVSDGLIAANYEPGVNITARPHHRVVRRSQVTWDEGLMTPSRR
jgi:hypothetical protein